MESRPPARCGFSKPCVCGLPSTPIPNGARLVTSAGVWGSAYASAPRFALASACGVPRPAAQARVGPPPLPRSAARVSQAGSLPRFRFGSPPPLRFGLRYAPAQRCPACGGRRLALPAPPCSATLRMAGRVGRSLRSLSPAPAAVGAFSRSRGSVFRLPAARRSMLDLSSSGSSRPRVPLGATSPRSPMRPQKKIVLHPVILSNSRWYQKRFLRTTPTAPPLSSLRQLLVYDHFRTSS